MEGTISTLEAPRTPQTGRAAPVPTGVSGRIAALLRTFVGSSSKSVQTLVPPIRVIDLEGQFATYFDQTVSEALMLKPTEIGIVEDVYFGPAISERIVRARVEEIGPGEPFISLDDFAE